MNQQQANNGAQAPLNEPPVEGAPADEQPPTPEPPSGDAAQVGQEQKPVEQGQEQVEPVEQEQGQSGGSTVTYTQDLEDKAFMGTYPATSQSGGKKHRAKKSMKSRSGKKAKKRTLKKKGKKTTLKKKAGKRKSKTGKKGRKN